MNFLKPKCVGSWSNLLSRDYNYLTKEGEKKFPKRLEDCLTEKDEQVRKTKLEKKKHEFKKTKIALELKRRRKFKKIPKHLMYDDPNDNKSYLLGLKTYEGVIKNSKMQNFKNILNFLIDLSYTKLKKKEKIV